MIRLQNVTKSYGNLVVLNDITMEIPARQITSFIGPNGAGKSTLLSVISRLIKMDQGSVYIDGKKLTDWNNADLSRIISILKQTNNIGLKLTIRELVSFGRFPYSQGNLTKEDWNAVEQALDYMKLKDIEDKYLHELSGGQRQRAYIAMVIAQDTDYILLDEPLNNLDMQHAVEIMQILKSLVNDLGKTVIIVIHDINFASCYSDYIVAMQDGKVVQQGKPNQIIDGKVLGNIYNLDFRVEEIDNQRICVYY